MNFIFKMFLFFAVVIATLLTVSVAFASTTDGTVTGVAWSENIGWINFGATNGNVHVTDTVLTGTAWNKYFGWIKLNPTNGGVTNNSEGTLSGTAWGNNIGWVNFSGVTINSSGLFRGTATGSNVGHIYFSCTNCNVTTDWRPASSRGGGGGGGGGDSPQYHNECSAGQCVSVSGAGSNQCSSSSDCVVTHLECSNGSCISVNGVGSNQCQANADCAVTHNECLNQQCVIVNGFGVDQCHGNNDCITPKHNECSNQKCVVVDGAGSDQCNTDNECYIYHNECSNQKCTPTQGVGIDQCQKDFDCITPKHNECSNQRCITIDGSGSDLCQTDNDCLAFHNECSNEKCISVSGSGQSQCQTNNDCYPPPSPGDGGDGGGGGGLPKDNPPITEETIKPVDQITKTVEESAKKIVEVTQKQLENVKVVAKEVKLVVNTSTGSVITKTVSTTGVVAVTAAGAASIWASVPSLIDLLSMPLRLLGLLLTVFGIKKRIRPWGTVYDSVTKQPLDPARVLLKNYEDKKEINSATTDLDGRYGFLVEKGNYFMEASKTDYIFPSRNLAGHTEDEVYKNLYFGEDFQVTESDQAIAKNIPLDPVGFNFNEFVKKNQKLNRFWSRWDNVVRIVSDIFFVVGFFVAIIAYFAAPYPYNTVVMGLYVFLGVLILLGLKPKNLGCIIEKSTGYPIPFAIVRVLIPPYNVEFSHKVTDKRGRYFCLAPKGQYFVKVERKNSDGNYSLVYTSPILNGKKQGIVKTKFKV